MNSRIYKLQIVRSCVQNFPVHFITPDYAQFWYLPTWCVYRLKVGKNNSRKLFSMCPGLRALPSLCPYAFMKDEKKNVSLTQGPFPGPQAVCAVRPRYSCLSVSYLLALLMGQPRGCLAPLPIPFLFFLDNIQTLMGRKTSTTPGLCKSGVVLFNVTLILPICNHHNTAFVLVFTLCCKQWQMVFILKVFTCVNNMSLLKHHTEVTLSSILVYSLTVSFIDYIVCFIKIMFFNFIYSISRISRLFKNNYLPTYYLVTYCQ